VWEVLVDDAQLTCRGGKHDIPAAGADGGEPGALGSLTLNAGTPAAKRLPSRFSGVRLKRGDLLMMEKAGGGGLGDPRARPFDDVLADVLDGYVSRAAAIEHYGADPVRLDDALALHA
jgi:N-methylhydantoinase B